MSDYSIEIVSVPVVRRRRGLYLQAAEWVAAESFGAEPFDAEALFAQTVSARPAAGSPEVPEQETPVWGEIPQGETPLFGEVSEGETVRRMVAAGPQQVRRVPGAEAADGGAGPAEAARAESFGREVFPGGAAVSPESLSPSAVTRPAAVVAGGGRSGAFGYGTELSEVRAGTEEEWTRRIGEAADRSVASALAGLRVYVVESDITEAQQAVRAVVEQSKI